MLSQRYLKLTQLSDVSCLRSHLVKTPIVRLCNPGISSNNSRVLCLSISVSSTTHLWIVSIDCGCREVTAYSTIFRSFSRNDRTKSFANFALSVWLLWPPFVTVLFEADDFPRFWTNPGRSTIVQCISLGPDRSIRSIASLKVWSVLPSSPKIRSVAYFSNIGMLVESWEWKIEEENDLLNNLSHDTGTELITREPEIFRSLYEFLVILCGLARNNLRLDRGQCSRSLPKGDFDRKTSAQGWFYRERDFCDGLKDGAFTSILIAYNDELGKSVSYHFMRTGIALIVDTLQVGRQYDSDPVCGDHR